MKFKLYRFDNQSMEFKSTKLHLLFLIICVVAISVGISMGAIFGLKNTQIITLEQEELVILLNDSEKKNFKPEMVYKFLVEHRAPFPEILYAQAILESNNFKSSLFMTNNNCYGMREPGKRVTMSKGESYGYASFDTWKDCILDRLYYNCLYLNDIKTEEQYYQYLDNSGYAEDPNYISKVRKIAEQVKKEKNGRY